MSHVYRAKSFITDASALGSSKVGMAKEVKVYLEVQDSGGTTVDIDEILSVSSCKLNGDRVFVLVVLEDDVGGG